MKTVVLVYSGGLDTSVAIPMMREDYGFERVVTVTVDVGQPADDITVAEEKARALGTEHYTVDAKDEFARDYCFRAVKANGDYQGYPLSTSIARPIIAEKAVEVAKLRERNLTRTEEIEYAKAKVVPISQSVDKIWSIDENLWGRSIEGGRLEEPDYAPPEEIFQWTVSPQAAPDNPTDVTISFKEGIPVAVDGKQFDPASLIGEVHRLAGANGVGRVDIMEDRMLGLKVRENYECPAAVVLIKAHKALEALVSTRKEIAFKNTVDQSWADLAYEGLWYDPLKEDLEAFIDRVNTRVTGDVAVRLYKGSATVIGRRSPLALYSEDLASFDSKTFDQSEMAGMVKVHGMQARMYRSVSGNKG